MIPEIPENFYRHVHLYQLGYIRIGLGIIILVSLASLWHGYIEIWGYSGFVRTVIEDKSLFLRWELNNPMYDYMAYTLYALSFIAAFLILLGLYSRSAFIVLYFTLGHFFSKGVFAYYQPLFMPLCSFIIYFVFIDFEEGVSLSRKLGIKNKSGTPRWVFVLLKVQLTLFYLYATIPRFYDPAWQSGEIIRIFLGIYQSSRFSPEYFPILLLKGASYGVFAVEALISFGLWFRRTLGIFTILQILIHFFIFIFAELGPLQILMILLLITNYLVDRDIEQAKNGPSPHMTVLAK